MKPFNIAQVLADAGVNNDTSARKQIEYIPIGQIEADPGNFYDLPKLEELANSISIIGLQEPVVVRPVEDGRYRIISGHRRTAALRILIDRGEHDDKVMCIVERQQESEALTQLKLIMGNSENRVLTSAEQARQVEETQQLIYQLKQEGFDFPGRVRDYVSDICKISTGKIARLKVIRDGLAAEFVPSYESGELSESTAYELSRMSQDEQNIIFSVHGDKKKQLYSYSFSHIAKEMQKASESIPSKACPASVSGFACEELKARKTAAAKLHSWESLVCKANTCCLDCNCLPSCTHPCMEAKGKQRALRKVSKDAEKESARRVEEQRQPAVDAITESWKRMCSLAKDKGIDAKSVFTACRGWSCPSDCDDMLKYAEGQKKIAFNDPMPGMLSYETAKKLIVTADLLGCSIDYLLGRTDVKDVAAAPAADPEKCVKVDTWHTGDPPEPGDYIAYGLWDDEEACDMATWHDDGWDMDIVCFDSISAWTYPPDKAVPVSEAPAYEPEKCAKVDTWNTGTPPKPGWYICRIEVDGVDAPQYHKHWYGGKTWQGLVDDIETVTHWVPVLEEGK